MCRTRLMCGNTYSRRVACQSFAVLPPSFQVLRWSASTFSTARSKVGTLARRFSASGSTPSANSVAPSPYLPGFDSARIPATVNFPKSIVRYSHVCHHIQNGRRWE